VYIVSGKIISIYNTSYIYTVYDRGLINKHSERLVAPHPSYYYAVQTQRKWEGRGGETSTTYIFCMDNDMIVNILQQMLIISLSSFRPLTGWELHRFL
jgi:hypothetical protein